MIFRGAPPCPPIRTALAGLQYIRLLAAGGYKPRLHIDLESSHVSIFFCSPDTRAAVGYKPVLRLQICNRTFGGYKIGCFVFRVPRLQTRGYKEDPGLAITMVYFDNSNFSDHSIKLSSDQSAVDFLR